MRHLRTFRVLEAAVVVLLVCALSAAAAESTSHFRKAKKPKVAPYAIQTSVGPKRPVFDIKNAAPGDSGSARFTLANVGTKPARIEARRIRMARSALTPYLQVSVYDQTTRECLYPVRRKARVVRQAGRIVRPKPTGPCTTLGPWQNLSPRFDILPKPVGKFLPQGTKALVWKRKERHTLLMTWKVAASAPNAAAGKNAAFTMRWRARKG